MIYNTHATPKKLSINEDISFEPQCEIANKEIEKDVSNPDVVMLSNQKKEDTSIIVPNDFKARDAVLSLESLIIIFPNTALPTYPPIVIKPKLPPLVVVTPLPSMLTHKECTLPPLIKAKKACPNSCKKVANNSIGFASKLKPGAISSSKYIPMDNAISIKRFISF